MDEARQIVHNEAVFAPDKPTLVEKIARKIFPHGWVDMPELKGPQHDCLVIRSTITFDFIDRVKILFSGRAAHHLSVSTQNIIGEYKVAQVAFPLRPVCLERKDLE